MTGLQANACRWAGDGECDEPDHGSGLCADGTDRDDCAAAHPANACASAFDGVCDDVRYGGTWRCVPGSDLADRALAYVANACATAFNDTCEDRRYGGSGTCADGTDLADCAAHNPHNACASAFDVVCDDACYGGTGRCPDASDHAGCASTDIANACLHALYGVCDEARYGRNGACLDGSDTADCSATAFEDEAPQATASGVPGSPPFSGYMGFDAVPEEFRMAIDQIVQIWSGAVVPNDEMEFALALVDLNDDGVKELFVRFRSLPDVHNRDWRTFDRDGKDAPCQISIFGSPAPRIWRDIGSYHDLNDIRILESPGDENHRDLQWADGDRMRFVYNAVGGVWGWYQYID